MMVSTQEPEAGGLFELRSWKPAWTRQLDPVSDQPKDWGLAGQIITWPCKYEDLSWTVGTLSKNERVLGGRDGRTLGSPCWPASLTSLVNSRPGRDAVSKKVGWCS